MIMNEDVLSLFVLSLKIPMLGGGGGGVGNDIPDCFLNRLAVYIQVLKLA